MSNKVGARYKETISPREGGTVRLSLATSLTVGPAAIAVLALIHPDRTSLSDPEEALLATSWAVGLALSIWWTLSFGLCLVANTSGSTLLARLCRRLAMPSARRLAARQFAKGTLAIGLVALPACGPADINKPEMMLVESDISTTLAPTTLPSTVPPSTVPPSTVPPSTVPPSTVPPSTVPPSTVPPSTVPPNSDDLSQPDLPQSHRVTQGENLWSIATDRVAKATGKTPTRTEIASYWSRLVSLNLDVVQSGNVDMIFAGESILMPEMN